jgi:hypothetical protein
MFPALNCALQYKYLDTSLQSGPDQIQSLQIQYNPSRQIFEHAAKRKDSLMRLKRIFVGLLDGVYTVTFIFFQTSMSAEKLG